MFQIDGKFREIFGKQVYRTIFVRSLGGGNFLEIKKYYFGKDERFKREKEREYELHLENCRHHRGNVHTAYVDWDTGNPVSMGQGNQVVYSPEVLHEMQDANDIKTAVDASKGISYGVLMLIMCVAIGALGGFLIGQNLPAIMGAINPGPTPHA